MKKNPKWNDDFIKINYREFLAPSDLIRDDFKKIWYNICKKSHINIDFNTAISTLKDLVIYEAIDGSRTTLTTNKLVKSDVENALFIINYIHVLKSLGAKTCFMMIHTSYNRERGKIEFEKILTKVKNSAPLIKKYCMENKVICSFICANKKHELKPILNDISEQTKNGEFLSYFLFDYSEKWAMTREGNRTIMNLPDIDVHIRHTKFQFSGGWLPEKMSRSVFVYSQNGCVYSNWKSDEIVALIAISVLAKQLHSGELLNKSYKTQNEIISRYRQRELELFNKKIELRKDRKKLFIIGSPIGILQFYY